MRKVDYDERQHAVYAAGRQMSPDALQTWMEAFARHLPETRPLAWLDLGSGIGRMTPSLASTFGGPAYGSNRPTRCALKPSPRPTILPSRMRLGLPKTSHCQIPRVTQHCCSSSGTTSSIGIAPPGVAPGCEAGRQTLCAGELLRQDA